MIQKYRENTQYLQALSYVKVGYIIFKYAKKAILVYCSIK